MRPSLLSCLFICVFRLLLASSCDAAAWTAAWERTISASTLPDGPWLESGDFFGNALATVGDVNGLWRSSCPPFYRIENSCLVADTVGFVGTGDAVSLNVLASFLPLS
jgi:hypothetical protein